VAFLLHLPGFITKNAPRRLKVRIPTSILEKIKDGSSRPNLRGRHLRVQETAGEAIKEKLAA
jgi:hypothetical protein